MTKRSTLPSFAGYKPAPLVPKAHPKYFDQETGKLISLSKVKLTKGSSHEIHEVLDCLTLALEAGAVSEQKWLKEIFGTAKAFDSFLDEFESYDDCYRICDRWWTALSVLGNTIYDQHSFITCVDIAARLREVARESNQY